MLILSAIVLLVWANALGRTIVNLYLIPRLDRARAATGGELVSIVIPARDEERVIERTVRSMLGQTYRDLEVIVVNDRSTDSTGAILRSFDDPRLVVIDGEEPPPGWLGKPWALHEGSRRARGSLLLFVDADLRYAPETIGALVTRRQDGGAAMTCLLPHVEMEGFWEHIAMPQLAFTAFTLLPTWLSNRTRSLALAIGGGTGNFIGRDQYDAAGGHEALKDAVVDDVGLARLVRRHGLRSEVVRADEFVSLHMYRGAREIIEGFTKNMFAVVGRSYARAVVILAVSLFFSLGPYVMLLVPRLFWPGLASVALLTAARVVLYRSLRYRLGNAIFGHPLMVLFWTWIFLRSIWKTGVRGQLEWRGRMYDAAQTRFGGER